MKLPDCYVWIEHFSVPTETVALDLRDVKEEVRESLYVHHEGKEYSTDEDEDQDEDSMDTIDSEDECLTEEGDIVLPQLHCSVNVKAEEHSLMNDMCSKFVTLQFS